jgi:hypothetical protein
MKPRTTLLIYIVCGVHVVNPRDILSALNELVSLRAENAGLKKEITEAVDIIESDQNVIEYEYGKYKESDADRWLQRNKPKEGE